MGLLVAMVGFASSFAVTLQGLNGVGASPAEAASGLMALSVSMGVCGIVLSVWTRMPISVAWSTPGAALLATTGAIDGGFAGAVGGFIACAILLTLTGVWSRFGEWVACIPNCIANAMLGGILFGLCLAPVHAVAAYPLYALPVVLVWALVGRFYKLWAVPAALLTFMLVVVFVVGLPADLHSQISTNLVTTPVWITPEINFQSLVNIALPLFLVTMASQNIPGVTILKVNGYSPRTSPLFFTTGVFSLLSAPLGGHAVNLAAITAALCAGEDAHPDSQRRYWAAIVAGIFYIFLGVFAALVMMLVSLAPAILIQAVAGLALIGPCANSLINAFEPTDTREAAAVTFFVTASGVSVAGISAAFWGLLAGGLLYWMSRRSSSSRMS